jgi:hypothetical protein
MVPCRCVPELCVPGWCIPGWLAPGMMRPLDDASLGRYVPSGTDDLSLSFFLFCSQSPWFSWTFRPVLKNTFYTFILALMPWFSGTFQNGDVRSVPKKWGHIVTKLPGTKRPRGASSQGRFIPFLPGTDSSGTHSSGTQREGTRLSLQIIWIAECLEEELLRLGWMTSRPW